MCNEPSYNSRNLDLVIFSEPWILKYSEMKTMEKKLRQKSFFYFLPLKNVARKQTSTKTKDKDILTTANIMKFTLHLYFMVKYIYLFSTNRVVSYQ